MYSFNHLHIPILETRRKWVLGFTIFDGFYCHDVEPLAILSNVRTTVEASMQLTIIFALALTSTVYAFAPAVGKFTPKSTTVLFEDFTPNGMKCF
jgi:hypothetical protein